MAVWKIGNQALYYRLVRLTCKDQIKFVDRVNEALNKLSLYLTSSRLVCIKN